MFKLKFGHEFMVLLVVQNSTDFLLDQYLQYYVILFAMANLQIYTALPQKRVK